MQNYLHISKKSSTFVPRKVIVLFIIFKRSFNMETKCLIKVLVGCVTYRLIRVYWKGRGGSVTYRVYRNRRRDVPYDFPNWYEAYTHIQCIAKSYIEFDAKEDEK